jgi:hypothetical protein
MLTLMIIEVDQFDGFGDALISSFFHASWVANEGQDRAIVIHVRMAVQDVHVRDRCHRIDDRFNYFGSACVGKIGMHSMIFMSQPLLFQVCSLYQAGRLRSRNAWIALIQMVGFPITLISSHPDYRILENSLLLRKNL